MEIKWNQELFGVEIKDNENHFVISGQPSMIMGWDDAVKYYKDNKTCQLPTRKHLQLIANNIDEINVIIKANGGYEMLGRHWTVEEYGKFCAWYVYADKGIFVQCGCFKGTLDEFVAKVKKTHKGNKHEKDYLIMVEFVKAKFNSHEG